MRPIRIAPVETRSRRLGVLSLRARSPRRVCDACCLRSSSLFWPRVRRGLGGLKRRSHLGAIGMNTSRRRREAGPRATRSRRGPPPADRARAAASRSPPEGVPISGRGSRCSREDRLSRSGAASADVRDLRTRQTATVGARISPRACRRACARQALLPRTAPPATVSAPGYGPDARDSRTSGRLHRLGSLGRSRRLSASSRSGAGRGHAAWEDALVRIAWT